MGQRPLSPSAHTPSSFLRLLPRGKNWVSPGCQPGLGPDGDLGLRTSEPLGEWVGRAGVGLLRVALGERAWRDPKGLCLSGPRVRMHVCV